MFCLEDSLGLDGFFTFSVFLLVFAIGVGLGVWTRGP
jgi:hypothetical protein